jgi:hypothetical protein
MGVQKVNADHYFGEKITAQSRCIHNIFTFCIAISISLSEYGPKLIPKYPVARATSKSFVRVSCGNSTKPLSYGSLALFGKDRMEWNKSAL